MILIEKMDLKHIDEVHKIECECFSIPWSKTSFENEIEKNKMAIYLVVTENEKVLGYGGMWHVINEGHITNIAVSNAYRKRGICTKIIEEFVKIANLKEMIGITLEVRKSNESALRLYKKLGFLLEGIRKEYYDDREDAIIMWKHLYPHIS